MAPESMLLSVILFTLLFPSSSFCHDRRSSNTSSCTTFSNSFFYNRNRGHRNEHWIRRDLSSPSLSLFALEEESLNQALSNIEGEEIRSTGGQKKTNPEEEEEDTSVVLYASALHGRNTPNCGESMGTPCKSIPVVIDRCRSLSPNCSTVILLSGSPFHLHDGSELSVVGRSSSQPPIPSLESGAHTHADPPKKKLLSMGDRIVIDFPLLLKGNDTSVTVCIGGVSSMYHSY